MTTVEVADDMPGIWFRGVNKTGANIHDFTFKLGDSCGVRIEYILVRSSQQGGCGDWDVDDDRDGESQEWPNEAQQSERDNYCNPKEKKARVDDKGATPPGTPIRKGKEFTIRIRFTAKTTGTCTLTITPTDWWDFQLCSLTGGMQDGANICAVDNETATFPGMGSVSVNATGQTIMQLDFETAGDYLLEEVWQLDAQTDEILATASCGLSTTCGLALAGSVLPGGIVGFGATFDQLGPGDTTFLTITADTTTPPPTGACCLPDGSCADGYVDGTCTAADGIYQGIGVTCAIGADCDIPPTGACCLLDGVCEELIEYDCLAADGTYEGDETLCGGTQCPQPTPTGACCLPDGVCEEILTDAECLGEGGVYNGDGTMCLGDNNGNGIDDTCEEPIPTVSEWGLILLTLLLLTAGTVALGRRRRRRPVAA